MIQADAQAFEQQVAEHHRVIEAMRNELKTLECIADALLDRFNNGARLYILGNGGSAADAQHIAAELVGRFKVERRALPAIALTTDTSILTAVGNDYNAEAIFVRQVDAHVRRGDVVWALSVSGTSPNVIDAIRRAREIGATIIGFTGKSGGKLAESCDHCLRVDHTESDRVQEAHQLAYHLICDRIERALL